MKFFLTILPLIIGSSSCSDHVGSVGTSVPSTVGSKVEPRTVRDFVETGYRYLEPVPVNHVSPFPYRTYYGQRYSPIYDPGFLPVRSTSFVEVHPSYGYYPPQGYNYPAYGHSYPQSPYPYYRPYSSVFVKEVRPFHIPGEHHRAHHQQHDFFGKPVHVNHVVSTSSLFGAPKTTVQSVQYVEDPVVEQPKVVDKKVEETVGGEVPVTGSVYQRSSVQEEPEVASPVSVPVVVPVVLPVVVPEVTPEVPIVGHEIQPEASSVQSSVVKFSEEIAVADSGKVDQKKKFEPSKDNGKNKKPFPTNKKQFQKTQESVSDPNQVSETVQVVVADSTPVVPYSMPVPVLETDARSAQSVVVPAVSFVPEPAAVVPEQVSVVPQSVPVASEVVKTHHELVPVVPTVPEPIPAVPQVVKAVRVQAVIVAEAQTPVGTPVVVSPDPVPQQIQPKDPEPVKKA